MSEPTVSTEVANASKFYRDSDLANLDSFASVLDSFSALGLTPESMSDYGTGFEVLDTKEKQRLVDVDFAIIEWRFNSSEVGSVGEFVSAALMTKRNEKYIINDGSTGIYQQLRLVTDQRNKNGHPHPQAALMVKGGLTVSNYTYTDEKGKQTPATTFYLNTAATN